MKSESGLEATGMAVGALDAEDVTGTVVVTEAASEDVEDP